MTPSFEVIDQAGVTLPAGITLALEPRQAQAREAQLSKTEDEGRFRAIAPTQWKAGERIILVDGTLTKRCLQSLQRLDPPSAEAEAEAEPEEAEPAPQPEPRRGRRGGGVE